MTIAHDREGSKLFFAGSKTGERPRHPRSNAPRSGLRAGLDPTYISGIERGLRNPGIKNVARLAKALGLTTAELCKGVEA